MKLDVFYAVMMDTAGLEAPNARDCAGWQQSCSLWCDQTHGCIRDDVLIEPAGSDVLLNNTENWDSTLQKTSGSQKEDQHLMMPRTPEGKRPLGRPRRRLVDNNRMDLQEVGCGYVDWIGLEQDRDRWRKLVSAVMNLRVP